MYDPKFSQKQMYDQYGSSRKTTTTNANKQFADTMKSSGGGRNMSGIGAKPPSFGGGQDNNPNRDESENKSTVAKVYEKAVDLFKSFGADEPKDVIVDGKRVYQGPAFRGYDPTTRIGDFGGEYGKKNYFLGMESFPTYPRTDVSPTLPPSTINAFGVNRDNPRLNMFGVERGAFRDPDPLELSVSPEMPSNMDAKTRALSQGLIPTEVNYTIKEGDTLSEIAQEIGTTVQELQQLNNIPDSMKNKIFAGDTIKVPVKKLTATQAALRRGFEKDKNTQGVETALNMSEVDLNDLSQYSTDELVELLRSFTNKMSGDSGKEEVKGRGQDNNPNIPDITGSISIDKIKKDYVDGYLKGHEGVKAHASLEGGKDTAAYGIKNSLGLERSDYESDRDFAAAVALKHYEATEADFKSPKIDRFGRNTNVTGVWEELGEAGRYALTDLHFNTGTVGSSAADGNAKDAMTNTLNYIGMTTKDGTKASLLSLSKRRAENWNKAADNLGLDKIDKIQQMPTLGGGSVIRYLNKDGDVIHTVSTSRKPVTLNKNGTYKELTETKEVKIK